MPEPIQTPVPAADELAAQVLLLAQSRLTADLRCLLYTTDTADD